MSTRPVSITRYGRRNPSPANCFQKLKDYIKWIFRSISGNAATLTDKRLNEEEDVLEETDETGEVVKIPNEIRDGTDAATRRGRMSYEIEQKEIIKNKNNPAALLNLIYKYLGKNVSRNVNKKMLEDREKCLGNITVPNADELDDAARETAVNTLIEKTERDYILRGFLKYYDNINSGRGEKINLRKMPRSKEYRQTPEYVFLLAQYNKFRTVNIEDKNVNEAVETVFNYIRDRIAAPFDYDSENMNAIQNLEFTQLPEKPKRTRKKTEPEIPPEGEKPPEIPPEGEKPPEPPGSSSSDDEIPPEGEKSPEKPPEGEKPELIADIIQKLNLIFENYRNNGIQAITNKKKDLKQIYDALFSQNPRLISQIVKGSELFTGQNAPFFSLNDNAIMKNGQTINDLWQKYRILASSFNLISPDKLELSREPLAYNFMNGNIVSKTGRNLNESDQLIQSYLRKGILRIEREELETDGNGIPVVTPTGEYLYKRIYSFKGFPFTENELHKLLMKTKYFELLNSTRYDSRMKQPLIVKETPREEATRVRNFAGTAGGNTTKDPRQMAKNNARTKKTRAAIFAKNQINPQLLRVAFV